MWDIFCRKNGNLYPLTVYISVLLTFNFVKKFTILILCWRKLLHSSVLRQQFIDSPFWLRPCRARLLRETTIKKTPEKKSWCRRKKQHRYQKSKIEGQRNRVGMWKKQIDSAKASSPGEKVPILWGLAVKYGKNAAPDRKMTCRCVWLTYRCVWQSKCCRKTANDDVLSHFNEVGSEKEEVKGNS